MAIADKMIVQDVRCFQGEQRGELRPITLLIGENSTGKSTFLGSYAVLHRMLSPQFRSFGDSPDFNEAPFSMGSFRDIVRSRRGREGRINEFKLGVGIKSRRNGMPPYAITATFAERGSEPIVTSWHYGFNGDSYVELRRDQNNMTIASIPGLDAALEYPFDNSRFVLYRMLEIDDWPADTPEMQAIRKYARDLFGTTSSRRNRTKNIFRDVALPLRQSIAPVAPLRAKPKRTYDPVREVATAEGDHIPMMMMRLDRQQRKRWGPLKESLTKFGKEAGLFSDIKVRQRGKQISDPFQLQVKVLSGSHANIMDVGYGVSQSLPILVEVLNNDSANCVFLLQQPEVHLHPKGQAELASLFVEAAKSQRRFLIETHSDYIIDRMRISVRKGLLDPGDVSILYFEPKSNSVDVHQITLDANGNIENRPPGYRSFFLRETDRLLGIED